MPPPDDTRNMAEVAAQMAFYFPTHFFKFQKAAAQQLMEWQFRQGQANPYPFGAPRITLIDIGSGVGTALFALTDLLAAWTEVFAELGYGQLGLTARLVAVDSDSNKEGPRKEMLSFLNSMLDQHSMRIEGLTSIQASFPDDDCIRQIADAAAGSTFTIVSMSNFLSSLPFNEPAGGEAVSPPPASSTEQGAAESQASILARKGHVCGEGSGRLIDKLSSRNTLLLTSEVDGQGKTMRFYARALRPAMELLIRRNRVRFFSPAGCYWYSLGSGSDGEQSPDPNCAVNFWSLSHWAA
jgi:hypothetical protein